MIEREWIRWWISGFIHQADPSWSELPWFTLSLSRRELLLTRSPEFAMKMTGIDAGPVDEPCQRLLQLSALSSHQVIALFRLIGEICKPGLFHLTESDKAWCDRLSKGLRPDDWIKQQHRTGDQSAVLYLLKSTVSDQAWQRLRLRFPREIIEKTDSLLPESYPLNRLYPLWDAALWRIEQRSSDVEPT